MRRGLRYFLTALLVLGVRTAYASPQESPQERVPPTRALIDGKTNPDAINKELLIAQIVGSMAIPASASPRDEQRLHLMAASIGFGTKDEQLLRTEMIRLHEVITPIQAQIQEHRPGGLPGVPAAELQAYREARLESYGRLLEILSKDGRDKLNAFIEKQVKNAFVIAPGPPR